MTTLAVTIGRGTLAARPTTMPAGSLYYVTDSSTLYRSNGATWDSVEAAAAAGYTDEQARDAIGSALVAGSGITVTVNDPSDTITIASSLTAGAPMHPGWVTGRYYGIQEAGLVNTPSTGALTANRLYLLPLAVPRALAVDRIGIQVTAAVASTGIRLGIYGPMSAAGLMGLVLDAGTVDSSTTGGKELTISQALAGGWPWLGVISNGAPSTPTSSNWLFTNFNGQTNLAGTDRSCYWLKDGTGGYSALPSTFSISGATSFNQGPMPMVRCG